MFCNVNLSNLENILQKNVKTDRPRECIFRASGGTNFANFLLSTNHGSTFMGLMCTGLPKKTLDMLLLYTSFFKKGIKLTF